MADSVVRAVPRLGLKEGVVALELCAQHLSSKPGTVSKVHGSAAWPSRSRAGAEHSYLSGLSLGCLVQPGAALLITRLHPVHCHISTHPQKPKLSSNLLSHAISFLHDQIDGQCAAHVDCLSPLSVVQPMCACT